MARLTAIILCLPDLEKAASGASGACGHFVKNHSVLRIVWVENPPFLTENGGRRVEDQKLRMDQGKLRLDDREWRIENSEMRLEGCGLRIHNQDLRILPCYTHIWYKYFCCESRYFENIRELRIFRLRIFYNFFQVCASLRLVFTSYLLIISVKFRKDPSFRWGDILLFLTMYNLELKILWFSKTQK